MKKLTLEIQGQEYSAFVQKIKGKLWLHLNGKTLTYRPEIQGGNSSGPMAEDPRRIVSPMPGKIIKVLKKVGDQLGVGETVVVMEAMKMEYNLATTASVKIEKINCQEGQQVALGDTLVEMEVIDE